MDDSVIESVIECLKKSKQRLCWVDTIVTPVREIVPKSPRCENMRAVVKELENRGIIERPGGFMSLANRPAYWVPTSFCLTTKFFNTNCTARKVKSHQLSLFNHKS